MAGKNKETTRYVRRGADIGVFIADAITPSFYGEAFALSQVAGFSELTAMYDQYKINGIKLTFYPRNTEITPLPAAPNNARVIVVTDYNDNTAPTSLNELREYEDHRTYGYSEKFTHYIDKPKFVDSVSSVRNGWIATSNPSQRHYGLKFAAEAYGLGPVYGWAVEAEFFMSFKNLK